MSGWVKMFKKSTHSSVFEDSHVWHVFCWLLFNANYKERTLLNGLTLKAGQLCTSRRRIAAGCFMNESRASRVLKRLQRCNIIVLKANHRGTVINIVNWGLYQQDEATGEPLFDPVATHWRPTGDPVANTEEEDKKKRRKELSICPQSDGLQTVNGSKVKLSYSADFEQFWQTFPSRRKTKKRKAFADFKKATKRVDLPILMAAVEEYAKSNKGRGEFCQMPSTWLNGDCWEDDRNGWNEGTPLPTPKRKKTQAEIEAQIRSRELTRQLNDLRSQGLGMTDEAEAIKQQMQAL